MPTYANPFDQLDDLRRQFYADNPEAAFARFLQGWSGLSQYQTDWSRRMFPQFYQRFLGEVGTRPVGYSWLDFLNELDLDREFQSRPMQERGRVYSRFAPTVRWII